MNMFDMMNFMQNPMQMLCKRFNIPQNINTNDPNEILKHLVDSGQVSQAQVQQAIQMQKMFNVKSKS